MTLALLVLALPLASPLHDSEDWPRYLGPNGNATTAAIDSDFEWSREGPLELWRQEIGPGFGGPAVRDGRVFLFDRDAGEGDVLRVFDLATGEELWSAGYEAPGRLNFAGSRTVPWVADDMVYTCGGFGQISAFDREQQALAWQVDMAEAYGGIQPMFGWSAAPLVVGDKVIVTVLGEEVGLLALDRHTGEEVWITEPLGFSHSAPVLLNLLGEDQILFLSTKGKGSGTDAPAQTTISSFDPEFGTLRWQTETALTRLPIPPPVRIDDQRFFLTGGYRGGSSMMAIAKGEEGYEVEELFHIERGCQTHLPLRYGDHLYLLVNENWNDPRPRRKEGGLLCLSLEGEQVWRTGDEPYFGRGNALLAGDKLLIQDGKSGILRVIDPSPEGYREIASLDLFGVEDRRDHQMWAPMALAGDKLLLRSQEELVCVQL